MVEPSADLSILEMSNSKFIVGNWGTTSLKLMLVEVSDGSIDILDDREGPGAHKLRQEEFGKTLFSIASDWLVASDGNPVLLAGMVGSTIGWKEVDYLDIADCGKQSFLQTTCFVDQGHDIHIVKGLKYQSGDGEFDVMRGEEVEIAGALACYPELGGGEQVLCIPGTHAKWVKLFDGRISSFTTSVAGELFAGLKQNGVLIPSNVQIPDEPSEYFGLGVQAALKSDKVLVHQLFSARTRQLLKGETAEQAADRLSGIVIASDVAGMLKQLDDLEQNIIVIGNDSLVDRYCRAIRTCGKRAIAMPTLKASSLGFSKIIQTLK